jgi:SAM-dependent methyltransferase
LQTKSNHRIQDRWDHIAAQVPDLYPAASTQYYRRREIDLITSTFGSLHGKKVLKLDLWNEAFNTRILNWMASQNAEVHGLDISSEITNRARQNGRSDNQVMDLTQADIRLIPYAENCFDFVYTMGTIEHVDEYTQAISEVYRVLKPGGKAIIGVPYKWDIFLRPLFVNILDTFGLYLYSPEISFSWRGLRQHVEASGLQVRRRRGILFMPGILRMLDLFFLHNGINLFLLMKLMLSPFEFVEKRWKWSHLLCYLIAAETQKAL